MSVRELLDVGLRVGGKTVASRSDSATPILNPTTGKHLFDLPVGSDEDIDAAVTAAREAFESNAWSSLEPGQRKRLILGWADLIEEHAARLDELDAIEMGKPLSLGAFGAARAANLVRFYAEAIDKCEGETLSSDRHSTIFRRGVPRGVVAAITPWNFPTYNAAMKIAPALAAGNAVVLKPSEMSSQTALLLADLAVESGLPPGIVNVVPGHGPTAGRALALHPGVDMIVFTGSTTVGKLMLQYSGQSNMKPVVVECGGKSPHVVFDDGVDLDAAAATVASYITVNQGQWCSAGSRLIVQKTIAGRFVEMVVEKLRAHVIGDPLDRKTTFGPLVNERQMNRVLSFIERGTRDATIAFGGRRVLESSGGFYVEPTVFCDVPAESPIAREEVFGPVLTVSVFEGTDEAIRLANATDYGLAAYVWTADLATGFTMSRSVRAGAVMINANPPLGSGPGPAFSAEPYGLSGIGIEGGMLGLMAYRRQHLSWFNHR